MKTKTSATTNLMKRLRMWRNQYAVGPVFNPVVEGVMDCGTVYPSCWSGSRARAVSIKRGSRRRHATGRLWRIHELSVLVSVALLFSSQLALAQFSHQQKLVGTGAIGNAGEGMSVSVSSDGNTATAIVGGPYDDGDKGAVWVYTRSGGVWTQQDKLVGKQAIGIALLGGSVSLSSDGNTAIVGGPYDDGGKGAVWVYTRSGGSWTQQQKLVITNPTIQQDIPVSLSSDGNTAIVGGNGDNGGKGAAWVYMRSGGSWTQQQNLVGTETIGDAWQGYSVSLSADGDTAIVGGPFDDGEKGAAWVYTRSGGAWTQLGSKLVDTGAMWAQQGKSVSVSSDGNTAIVGGPRDNGDKGAAWVYVREIHLQARPWWWKYVAIDPMALILKGKALDIWFEIQHPHVPKVAEIQQVLRSMTPEEQKAALNRARTLENYAKAEEKMLRSMPQEEQKAALNRVRTLQNYAKAVEEAFATMKK
jgi:FG-GAP repeat